ncbi:Beta-1,3-galactosyl-O-glycosyl-glycoprotein beta-1,6-N-acetylglucosaminyltransferase 3 [Clonorchis sinensis]|uniref:Beta-1,3-galactosyl-O-glycosyl-glycoprotein beta-1,6-N-acetylglucosaminyltransferase 3 n=2 Tax=Clonorchis sinensis TaxID=79923 RepID=A0A8T1LWN4_CLOSI|nr:Beta-1,3-galactosyl-O-glycosyl-glycoprotein beta-1,6-N-acetylglucosaminyltransferase 3 [Clonorchis sinensis]GAA27949.1 beta-1,3-galactosyl-O-glycosyl-glycoprotein beta-1 6-N-acetylglucosaminyltransferase 3 [Clonorchis sinensis]
MLRRRTRVFSVTVACLILLLGWGYYYGSFQQRFVPRRIANQSAHDCLKRFGVHGVNYNFTVSLEERDFPIGFSLLVYTQPERATRLLAAIYRPQNVYCVHVDKKSSEEVTQVLLNYATCFDANLFFVPNEQRIAVHWGSVSVLEAELICARLLLNRTEKWNFWINLTGQEFPLRTNWELVRALRLMNNTNLVAATYKGRNLWRFPPKNLFPHNITWYKGPVHLAVRREFVDFMLSDSRAISLLESLKKYESERGSGIHPEETYFATLNHNPHFFPVPGAFLGIHEYNVTEGVTRYKVWQDSGIACGSGHWIRTVCILGVNDLPRLFKSPHFFANKFLPDVEPEAYEILESWLAEKVSFESTHRTLHSSFNASVYAKLEMTWNHL